VFVFSPALWLRRALRRGVALCGIGLLGMGAALAQDHVVERHWLEDPRGQWRLEDLEAQRWQAFEGVLSRGFGTSVIWIRLRIDPTLHPSPAREPDRLVLRVRPVYLDDIQVHDPSLQPGKVLFMGDRHHPRRDEMEGLDFLMPLPAGTQARDIWLRVSSTSTRQIDAQVLNVPDLNRLSRHQQLVFAGYMGLIAVLMVWGAVYYVFSREKVIGAFTFKLLSALVYAAASLGFLRETWPLAWPVEHLDLLTTVFSIGAVSAALLFHVLFLLEYDPAPRMRQVLWALLALFPLKMLWVALDQRIWALQLNMTEVLLLPLVLLAVAWTCQAWKNPKGAHNPALTRPVVVGFYALLVVVLAAAAMPALGLTPGKEIALYIVQIHGLLTGSLILLMLQYRAHVVQRRQQQTALTLERTQMQIQEERRIREDQERLLAMLAHEIKTPLATMHLRLDPNASGSREIRQAIRDMNSVIERCIQTAQLGDRQLAVEPEDLDVVGLVHDAVSACAQPSRIRVVGPPQLRATNDRQLLFIVLSNLLENACKYAAPDSTIELQLSDYQDAQWRCPAFELVLRNCAGPAGWPDPAQVFGKYYRHPRARRQAGTGLGLYLVRHLTERLGGRIDYEPDRQWVRFVLRVPLQSPMSRAAPLD